MSSQSRHTAARSSASARYPLDHVVIYARDPAASARFHALLLAQVGFVQRRERLLERDGLFIDIRQATHEGPARARSSPGVDHLGFRVERVEQLYAARDVLESVNLDAGRLIEFDEGDIALFVTDPDGLRIELTCYVDPNSPPVD